MSNLPQRPERSLPAAFARRVRRAADAVALSDGGRHWTFRILAAAARRLAVRLAGLVNSSRKGDPAPEPRVALLAEPRGETVVALLAILESGAAYVPLDPAHPAGRHGFVLRDARVSVLVGRGSLLAALIPTCDALGITCLDLDRVFDSALDSDLESKAELDAAGGSAPLPAGRSIDPRRLAYIIYTSGSTGRPKGVGVSHGAVCHLVAATAAEHPCEPGESAALFHSLAFDLSVWELWRPLLGGGRLVVVPERARRSGSELLALLEREGMTQLNLTPSALRLLLAAGLAPGRPPTLRWLGIGGEALEPERLRPWLEDPRQRVEVVGLYGPTEATVWAACHRLKLEDLGPDRDLASTESAAGGDRAPPIGRPLHGWSLEILDARGERAVEGEIVLGGIALSRGYLGRPALSAERFVPDPAGDGARRYRTGDRGRRRDDGVVEFLGRDDQQVKLRGFRLELGEVEARLGRHPALVEGVVVLEYDALDEPLLVAHLVLASRAEPSPATLGDFLAEQLPAIAIPSRWWVWPELPRSISGKIDRRRLAARSVEGQGMVHALGGESMRRPRRGEGELAEVGPSLLSRLATLWGDLLELDPQMLGAEDHFFRLGGHSLLATQLLTELRDELGIEVAAADFLSRPTLGGLAEAVVRGHPIASRRAVGPRSEAGSGEHPSVEARPATPQQLGFWLAQESGDEVASSALHTVSSWLVKGPFEPARLVAAWCQVVVRHPALRTVFRQYEGTLTQRALPPAELGSSTRGFARVDLDGLDAERRSSEAEVLWDRLARQPFDLSRGPLWRCLLIREEAERWRLGWVAHHIVADGWSEALVAEELTALYRDPRARLPPPGPWPGEEDAIEPTSDEELAGLRAQLAGLPRFELPADRGGSASRRAGRRRGLLAPDVTYRLGRRARAAGTTPSVVMLALAQAFLARLATVDSLVLGWPDARRHAGNSRSVGCFADLLVLRGDLAEEAGARPGRWVGLGTALDRLAGRVLTLLARPGIGFAHWRRIAGEAERTRPAGELGHPVVQAVLAPQDGRLAEAGSGGFPWLELPGLELVALEPRPPATRFELELHTRSLPGGGLRIDWIYPRTSFDATTVERWRRAFETFVDRALEAPRRALDSFPLSSRAETHQILLEWSHRRSPRIPDSSLVETVARWARRLGERPALVAEDADGAIRTLSWHELVARAAGLARTLRRCGLGDEEPVGLVFERGPEMVVAMLAVLAAGGLYVPLDPTWPTERRRQVSRLAGIRRLLCGRRTRRKLGLGRKLGGDDGARATQSDVGLPAQPRGGGRRLAYLLFTSGSTGRPKGVAVAQAGIHRLVALGLESSAGDAFLQLAPATFDASTFEIWGALLGGRSLVIAPPGALSIAEIGRLVERHRVSTLFLTTPLFHQAAREPVARFRRLSHLLTGGDVLWPTAAAAARRALAPTVRLYNAYGPTENTVFSALHPLGSSEAETWRVPLGRPLPHDGLLVVDRALRPSPIGVVGQIAIWGPGLARSYWRDPRATAERFVPHPRPERPGERLYLTGDRGRWLADGGLDFLGRLDTQVKIRGMRVEPMETERWLAALPGVAGAAVVAARHEERGEPRLVAFVVLEGEGPDLADGISVASWWRSLADRLDAVLPVAQQPDEWRRLGALPTTESGKVDRRRLAVEARRRGAFEASEDHVVAGDRPPSGPFEEGLAAIWKSVLGRPRVGAEADFFALGGDSLSATRVVAEIYRLFDRELPLSRLFEHSTLAALAAEVETIPRSSRAPGSSSAASGQLGVPEVEGPMSFAQRRLWFLAQLAPDDPTFVVTFTWRVHGRLVVPALVTAVADLVARHEGLRTTFGDREGEPRQRVWPREKCGSGAVGRVDSRALPADRRTSFVQAISRRMALRPCDPAKAPPWRLVVVGQSEDIWYLLLVGHHLVFDGAGVALFARELGQAYAARLRGDRPGWAGAAARPIDFARAQHTASDSRRQVLEAYWRDRLDVLPALELPVDRPPAAAPPTMGAMPAAAHRVAWRLDRRTTARLEALVRPAGATLWMGLLAAFFCWLRRLGTHPGAAVISPESGRFTGSATAADDVGMACRVELLVLRLPPEARSGGSFASLLDACRDTALGALEHRGLPFERLVSLVGGEARADLRRHPLAQASLAWHPEPPSIPELVGARVESVTRPVERTHLDLELHLWPVAGGGVEGHAVARRDLLDRVTAERWARLFERLAARAIAEPSRPIATLDILSSGERQQLLVEWNDTGQDFATVDPASTTLDALLLDRLSGCRGPVLETAEGEVWSAHRLLAVSRRLADALERSLVPRSAGDVVVAVLMGRGPLQLAAFLAVLRSGAAYLPLDPADPPERRASLLAESGVAAVLGERKWRGAWADGLPWIDGELGMGVGEGSGGREHDAGPKARALAASPAYVLYTSGSSGRPKGVVVSHRAIVHHMLWIEGALALGPRDRLLQKTPAIFDASIWEYWLPLMTGSRLVFAPPGIERDAEALLALLEQRRITVLQVVPSLLRMLLEVEGLRRCHRLRLVVCGGEALPHALYERFRRHAPAGARLINVYGPTEATIHASWEPRPERCVPVAEGAIVPLGRPLANTRIFVVDTGLRAMPIGVAGRVMIAGPGLGRGYHHRARETARVFVPDPWGEPGGRLYDSGDRGRRRSDGRLEYLGRSDGQIKWRGIRLEPGEVEAALERHPAVARAIVVLRDDPDSQSELVAWLLGSDGEERPTDVALRRDLRERLPATLLPGRLWWREALPLTPAGKIDRRRLVAEAETRAATTTELRRDTPRDVPRDALAAEVAQTWRDILGGGHWDESFFELGGHSLLATRLLARIRKIFGTAPTLAELFARPTLGDLVCAVRDARRGDELQPPALRFEPVSPRPHEPAEPEPLTLAQRRLEFLHRLAPRSTAYAMPFGWRVRGRMDGAALEFAFARVVERHPALRSRFREHGGEVWQCLGARPRPLLPRVALDRLGSPETGRRALSRLLRGWAARPFELAKAPPFRAASVRLGEHDHLVLINVHHIVFDGWSAALLASELGTFYAGASESPPSPALPAPGPPPGAIARAQRAWLDHPAFEAQRQYWRRQLADLPRLELPTDREPLRRAAGAVEGAERPAAGIDLEWPEELVSGLESLALRHGATPFMVLFASFAALLWRFGAGDDLALGTPVAGRRQAELEGVMGFFVNLLVLRLGVERGESFARLLGRARRVALEAYDHQELPFERLVEELAPERDGPSAGSEPLVRVTLALQNMPRIPLVLEGSQSEYLALEPPETRFALELYLWRREGGMAGRVVYRRDLFDDTTIRRLASTWRVVLEQLVAPGADRLSCPLEALAWSSPAERHQLVVEWGGPRRRVGRRGRSVVERFLDRAGRRPDATAIRHGARRWSYGELARHAALLAHELRSAGVSTERRVALYLEPSPELVLAMVAVLMAGGAYLPLDPAHASARSHGLVRDAGVVAVICRPGDALPTGELPRIELTPVDTGPRRGRDGVSQARACDSDTMPVLDDRQLAYVIHTSGSTGRPKGVGISHRALDRLVAGACAPFRGRPSDRWSLFHSAAFDFSVWEIWGALTTGGSVVVIPEAVRRDGRALLARLHAADITVLDLTPSALDLLLEAGFAKHPPPTLRWVLFGGERLDPARLAPFLERSPDGEAASGIRWANLYGITETTVHATFHRLTFADLEAAREGRASPVGRPLVDGVARVVSPAGRLVPTGVVGELWIGGGGVARGYLDRPALTAERFVPDAWSRQPGARLYRSGDRARRRGDGGLEILGRIDRQLQVRGHRIEPGEIEAVLRSLPGVAAAVVVGVEPGRDSGVHATHSTHLVAAVVPAADALAKIVLDEDERVERWRQVYDTLYREKNGGDLAQDPLFDIRGWTSGLSGRPFAKRVMRRWHEGMLARLRALRPEQGGWRIWEIGCGSGLLVHALAPEAEHYHATDLSPATLARLAGQLGARGLDHVVLEERPADDFRGIAPASFDLVILSSVIQYFPGAESLLRVLRGALRATRPGGAVFVGDVRNLATFEVYCAQRARLRGDHEPSDPRSWIAEQRRREAWAEERELLVHPALFPRLAAAWPELADARVLSRGGEGELFRHRYDVVLERAAVGSGPRRTPKVRHAAPLTELVNDPLIGERRYRWRRALRRQLTRALPGHMVPSRWLVVHSLPLTVNGKVDTKTLARLFAERAGVARSALPTISGSISDHEEGSLGRLLELWREVLDAPEAGPDEDFFELGGHSLLATRLLAGIRATFEREIPLAWLFEHRTARALATRLVASSAPAEASPLLRPRQTLDGGPEKLPLAPTQERLFFLEKLDPAGGAYVMPAAWRLRGRLAVRRLARALEAVVVRHESLRTTFTEEPGGPRQVVHPPHARLGVGLARIDLRTLGDGAEGCGPRRRASRSILDSACHQSFALEDRRPWRALLIEQGEDDRIFVLVTHHLVFDGRSERLFVRQLAAEYARGRQAAPKRRASGLRFGDFALWQRERLAGERLDRLLEVWRSRLSGAPRVELPIDHPRPVERSSRGAALVLALEDETFERTTALARHHGTTRFAVVLAAFFAYLVRLGGGRDLVVGTPVDCRREPALESVIGCFVNTLALRPGMLEAEESFGQLIDRLAGILTEALEHRDLPFDRLVAALDPSRDPSRLPLVEVVFALEEEGEDTLRLPGCRCEPQPLELRRTPFDWMVTLRRPKTGPPMLEWRYATALFDRTTVLRQAVGFARLLAAWSRAPEAPHGNPSMLSRAEHHQLVREWPVAGLRGSMGCPSAGSHADWLVRLLDSLSEGGEAVATSEDGRSLSRAELARRIRSRSGVLRRLGAGRVGTRPGGVTGFWHGEPRVAVVLDRSHELIETLLAVMALGGVAVPLDPEQPAARQTLQLEEAGVVLLVGRGERLRDLAARSGLPSLETSSFETSSLEPGRDDAQPIGRRASWLAPHPRRLALVFFTSGSTGRPKAVGTTHGALGAYLAAARVVYPLTGRGVPCFTSIAVDLSITSWLLPLAAGEPLEMIRRPVADRRVLDVVLRPQGWSLLKLTPSHLDLFAQAEAPEVTVPITLVLGGEPLTTRALSLARRLFPRARIFNEYGPSETTVGSSIEPVPEDDGPRSGGITPVAIGRPLAGDRLYVLDATLRPVPLGTVGELFIGGPGLARGYLGRPALSAERFLPAPSGGLSVENGGREPGTRSEAGFEAGDQEPGTRLHATGDRVRWLADGRLEMLGRWDDQLSLRGHRIEPGEVEAVLETVPGVARAVVAVVAPEGADATLVAALEPVVGVERPDAATLRLRLLEHLPEAWIPTLWRWVESLPRRSSGKVDRRAVAATLAEYRAGRSTPTVVGLVHPDPLVAELAALWGEVLGQAELPTDRGFFELGGHSLAATRLVSRLRRSLGLEVPLHRLLAGVTVTEMAAALRAPGSDPTPIPGDERGMAAPLSFGQLRVWSWHRTFRTHPGNHLFLGRTLRGRLDVAVLQAAWRAVVAAQGALRTVFQATAGGSPYQRVLPMDSGLAERLATLPLIDLPRGSPVDPRDLFRRFAERPFDLAEGPAARILLVRRAPEEHLLFAVFHHLVADGQSVGVLEDALARGYRSAVGRRRGGLTQPARAGGRSLVAFARWQHGGVGESDPTTVDDLPPPLPPMRRWPDGTGREPRGRFDALRSPARWPGPPTRARVATLSSSVYRELLALAQRLGASLQTVLLAAFAESLRETLGEALDDETLRLGTTLSNRFRPGLGQTFGMLVDRLVLELEPTLAGGADPTPIVETTRRALVEALARQETVEGRRLDHRRGPTCLAVLNLQSEYRTSSRWVGVDVEALDLPPSLHAKRDLTLQAHAMGQAFNLGLVFDADRISEVLAEDLLSAMVDLLERWKTWGR